MFRVRNTGSMPPHVWEIYWKVLKEGWKVVDAKRQKPFYFYYLTLKSPKGYTDRYLLYVCL